MAPSVVKLTVPEFTSLAEPVIAINQLLPTSANSPPVTSSVPPVADRVACRASGRFDQQRRSRGESAGHFPVRPGHVAAHLHRRAERATAREADRTATAPRTARGVAARIALPGAVARVELGARS